MQYLAAQRIKTSFLGTFCPPYLIHHGHHHGLMAQANDHDHCIITVIMLAPVRMKLLVGKHAGVESWRRIPPDHQ